MKKAMLFLWFLWAACSPSEVKEHKLAGNALGTIYHITYIGEEIDGLDRALDSMIESINTSLSTYKPTSLISQFNVSRTEYVDSLEYRFPGDEMSQFKYMVNLSRAVHDATGGAFDPSAAALFDLYKDAKSKSILIDSADVAKRLSYSGLEKIGFDHNNRPAKKDSMVQVNFNAIAKGYFVDIVADYIASKGIGNYMVEIGGEVRLAGKNSKGQTWRMGVNYPEVGRSHELFEVIEATNTAIATSGNYQNYYIVNDSLIGHTIDPRTGFPIMHEVKSATVLHKSCAVADAYATSIMVMGFDAIPIIEKDTLLKAFLIYKNNSGGLEGKWVN